MVKISIFFKEKSYFKRSLRTWTRLVMFYNLTILANIRKNSMMIKKAPSECSRERLILGTFFLVVKNSTLFFYKYFNILKWQQFHCNSNCRTSQQNAIKKKIGLKALDDDIRVTFFLLCSNSGKIPCNNLITTN